MVDYIDGELDENTRRELEEHLENCEPCNRFIRTYETTIKITKKVEPLQMPQELKDRLKSFIKMKTGDNQSPNG